MKKLMLSVVFCSSALFGAQLPNLNRDIRIDEVSILDKSAFLQAAILNWSLENRSNSVWFERGKIASEKFLIDLALSGVLSKAQETIVTMHDEHKKMDLGRYQPKEQEVIRFVYAAAYPVASDIVATMIVAKHMEDRMQAAKMKRPTVKPIKVALALANNAAREGLYLLICAEVHKHDSLAFARDYFPVSNDPKELSFKKDCVKVAYNYLYGQVKTKIASCIPENLPL